MARKSQPQEEPPSLGPEQAIPILEGLVRQGRELKREDRQSPKVTQWAETAERALAAAFGSQHESIHAFRREFYSGVYSAYDSPESLQQQFVKQVENSLAILESAVEQLRWKLPDSTQVFFPAGTQHDAYREIRDIVAKTTNNILIVDPYVDDTLWELLTNVPSSIAIRVLTSQMKGDFVLEAKKFARQHGNAIHIRQITNYHDRFLVVDGAVCWHLGASIKDAGNKAFAMSRFEVPELLKLVISHIETAWNGAPVVPL